MSGAADRHEGIKVQQRRIRWPAYEACTTELRILSDRLLHVPPRRRLDCRCNDAGATPTYPPEVGALLIIADLQGNAARFVNHSCEPNCVSLITNVEGKGHIVLAALRDIDEGEELCYDYKFAMEDAKIPCRCGSQFCRTVMN